ncbi:bifunctional hydroxymethylpyrimidine kinase/phosphomethylpyrimidine kinase [Halorhodospira halochloris]|uniref:bifunctional hydroxymethylpyrimidine kinase/phosphomethylpyrimidine kinase n=1 Tax=Halorhodospira halochloris TaxID=1052 RepID=UPI001EE93FCF|nr:bifunctional hydroxymethylpyrimidine kinase/phosphomethylpyrimidine kinase [Halorhodospira halochloris]MCG5548591.1 bifunctional hydroxymethylpyrimidine kinase/phosphomethylpyrimidine kinase [Halorhodospira halochloris]
MADRFGNHRVLVVAGSDSGGGAGIQADIKTVMALGGYATTAITALTAQNTLAVEDVHPVPPAFITSQMSAVMGDIGADCIKTGMLYDTASIAVVAEMMQPYAQKIPAVVDPVMVSQSGHRLLTEVASDRLREVMLPLATLVTPNLPEAEVLLGRPIDDDEQSMIEAAQELRELGSQAVLLKGGHGRGDQLVDVLVTASGVECWRGERLPTTSTHGTGCTLASAIATGIAQGMTLVESVDRARIYLRRAVEEAKGLGQGAGPVEHSFTFNPSAVGYTPQ